MIDELKTVITAAVGILFTKDTGIIPVFLGFIKEGPVLLLPIAFYVIFTGVKTGSRLLRGD